MGLKIFVLTGREEAIVKPGLAPLLGKKFLMESNLELLSKMNCFMNVLFIFTVLKLRLF